MRIRAAPPEGRSIADRRRRGGARALSLIAGLSAAIVSAACAHYSAKPVEPVAIAAAHDARTLGGDAARDALRRWRPAHSEPWPPAAWDRGDLIAVALELSPAIQE